MTRKDQLLRSVVLPAAVVLGTALVMGGDCTILLPPPFPEFNTVKVELVNETAFEVDPFIFFDPLAFDRDDLDRDGPNDPDNELVNDVNFFNIGPPLLPMEDPPAELTIDCFEIGTITSDFAEALDPDDTTEPRTAAFTSLDHPILIEDEDFTCGDIITFVYFFDNFGEFSTCASVNDGPCTFE